MLPTLLDIAKMNGNDAVVGLIEEASKPHPEILLMPARTVKTRTYSTLVRTGVPTGGSFRNANEGTDAKKSTFEQRLVACKIFEPRFEVDKAVADAHEDGAAAYIAIESAGIMEGALQDLCTQFYYGSDGKGFPGLVHAIAADMTVDAGGATAKTSVWGVRFGAQHVQLVMGQGGAMTMGDPRIADLSDAAGKKYTGYVNSMLAYPGLQVGSVFSVSRIKQLGTDAGKGLTDDLIYEMLTKWPEGTQPDVILLNGRSLEQLRKSRTATNATGAPAPIPESILGPNGPIPLKPTSAILNNE